MPTPELLAEKYKIQSQINADALSAFTTAFPLITVGQAFTAPNGLDWEVVAILPINGRVVVYARYVDAMVGYTDYIADTFAINARRLMLPFADNFTITGTPPVTSYVRTDMRYGEIMQLTIDGSAPLIESMDFTFDPETAMVTFIIAVMAGQVIDILYKKSPYYYGG